MSQNKWVRSISFNKQNPDDLRRLKLIGRKSFSKFVKRLIDEEIKRQGVVYDEPQPEPKSGLSRLERLKQKSGQKAAQNKFNQ